MSVYVYQIITIKYQYQYQHDLISTGNLLMRRAPPPPPLKRVLFTLHHDLQKKEP